MKVVLLARNWFVRTIPLCLKITIGEMLHLGNEDSSVCKETASHAEWFQSPPKKASLAGYTCGIPLTGRSKVERSLRLGNPSEWQY